MGLVWMGSEGVLLLFSFCLLSFALSFFFVFLRFFFFIFLRFSPGICWENGEFHSDPVCTDPVQNFPPGAD